MKDAYYFPHDTNARKDFALINLISHYGYEGYGVYWAIIETLRDQDEYKIESRYKDLLIDTLNMDSDRGQNIINFMFEVGLLTDDGQYVFSSGLCNKMRPIDEKRNKLRENGRKGGQANKQKTSNAKATLKQNESNAQARKEKKRKEKKSKVLLPEWEQAFQYAWSHYCKNEKGKIMPRGSKQDAKRYFAEINDTEKQEVLNAVKEVIKQYEWTYRPHLFRLIKNQMYKNYITTEFTPTVGDPDPSNPMKVWDGTRYVFKEGKF